MALTEEEVNALEVNAAGDLLVCKYVGWKVNRPTYNLVTAFQIEDVVKEAGLTLEYAQYLKEIVMADDTEGLHHFFLLANASALQRSKAFLMLHIDE